MKCNLCKKDCEIYIRCHKKRIVGFCNKCYYKKRGKIGGIKDQDYTWSIANVIKDVLRLKKHAKAKHNSNDNIRQ